MKLHWFGHSCFLLTNQTGKTLLFDPFNEKVGYELPAFRADIVLTSHAHYDHAYVDGVQGEFRLINLPGEFEEKGFRINGISTFHDDQNGSIRGKNIVYIVESDGLKICHLGDLGHILSKEQCEMIGTPDILLLPVGGGYTIDAEKAETVRQQLKPACTIPVHYKTKVCQLSIGTIDKFLSLVPKEKVVFLGNDLDCAQIAGKYELVVMEYGI